jgi:hypothetical protein
MPGQNNLDSSILQRSTQIEVLCWQDKVYSHSTLKKLKRSSKHACLVLFSSFGAIGAELKCGVHPHQVLATSLSKRGLCHNKKSERVRGNASTQPRGLCHNKNQIELEAKHPLFS